MSLIEEAFDDVALLWSDLQAGRLQPFPTYSAALREICTSGMKPKVAAAYACHLPADGSTSVVPRMSDFILGFSLAKEAGRKVTVRVTVGAVDVCDVTVRPGQQELIVDGCSCLPMLCLMYDELRLRVVDPPAPPGHPWRWWARSRPGAEDLRLIGCLFSGQETRIALTQGAFSLTCDGRRFVLSGGQIRIPGNWNWAQPAQEVIELPDLRQKEYEETKRARARENLGKFMGDLMRVAAAPSRLIPWCLDTEEARELGVADQPQPVSERTLWLDDVLLLDGGAEPPAVMRFGRAVQRADAHADGCGQFAPLNACPPGTAEFLWLRVEQEGTVVHVAASDGRSYVRVAGKPGRSICIDAAKRVWVAATK